jgi:hypothetical protein
MEDVMKRATRGWNPVVLGAPRREGSACCEGVSGAGGRQSRPQGCQRTTENIFHDWVAIQVVFRESRSLCCLTPPGLFYLYTNYACAAY